MVASTHLAAHDSEAEVIAEEFRNYAYAVSHDLSGPVRAMVGFSNLLMERYGRQLSNVMDEDGQEFLSLIAENGEKLQHMMDGLLTYSRINTQSNPLVAVDCSKLVHSSVSELTKNYVDIHKVVIGTLPVIQADANHMMILFKELLDNAFKFHHAGAKVVVKVSAGQEGHMWKFMVQDNGIGIKPDFSARIFQLFKRLHTDDEYPGVGVGLTLAQKIVEQHGGQIWCESDAGKGSTFYFTIPR